MKTRGILSFGSAFVLSLCLLTLLNFGKALAVANNCTWTGAGDGTSFSDATNWSNCGGVAPVSGDSLTFDSSTMGLSAISNDLNSLSIAGITEQGLGGYGVILTGNSFTLTGGISVTSDQNADIENNITVSGSQSFSTPNGTSLFLEGNLSGSGPVTFAGGGGLSLDGVNSGFSGGFQTADGGINANTTTALGTGTTTITDGGALDVNFDTDSTFSTPLNLGGNGAAGNASGSALYMSTLAYAGDGSTATWSGPITLTSDFLVGGFGNRILKITGPLSGGYAMQPADVDSNGVILNNSSNNSSNTPNGNVPVVIPASENNPATPFTADKLMTFIIDGVRGTGSVSNGGTLMGTGTVGDLIVDQGGVLAPGHSPGCLNTGNLTLNGSLDEEIGGTTACTGYDQVKVTGTVDLTNGTLNTTLYNGYKPKAGETYTIIDNDASDAVTGTFSGLAEGATFNVSGYVFKISYVGGTGNDVVLSVVSVPATPNTGVALMSAHPGLTLVSSMLAAGTIIGTARRIRKVSVKNKN